MGFAEIDEPFSKWAQENDLPIQTTYQCYETRGVEFTSQSGKKTELWLTHTDDEGIFLIKARNDEGFRKAYQVHPREAYNKLKAIFFELQSL